MKIVFAGQLDRAFANEYAISAGLDADDDLDLEAVEEQRSADNILFQMAGTLAVLSDEILSLPYVRYEPNPPDREGSLETTRTVKDPEAFESPAAAIAHFDQVADEALDLSKGCALLNELAATTDEVLDEVDREDAWIGHYHGLRHLHGDHGIPLAYLAGLLMQAHHAWETGAVLVIAECDRLILADLGAMIVRKRWPRPFAIPDLRYMGPPYDDKQSGRLLNLRPTDLADVDALKRDPGIRAYAASIARIVSGAETSKVGSALEKASQSRRSEIPIAPNEHGEFVVVVARARMFDNARTVSLGRNTTSDDWAQRRFPARMLRTIVLADTHSTLR